MFLSESKGSKFFGILEEMILGKEHENIMGVGKENEIVFLLCMVSSR